MGLNVTFRISLTEHFNKECCDEESAFFCLFSIFCCQLFYNKLTDAKVDEYGESKHPFVYVDPVTNSV